MTLAGLRPGEKLYEEKLMAEEGLKKTRNELIHIGCPIPFEIETFLKELESFSDLTGMLAIATLKAKRIPYIIESDGGFAGSGRGIKEKLKKWLLSSARIYFSTAEEHDKYYLTCRHYFRCKYGIFRTCPPLSCGLRIAERTYLCDRLSNGRSAA